MPFESEAQRRWMWATHPEMAERWQKHTPKGKKLPKKKRSEKKAGLRHTERDNKQSRLEGALYGVLSAPLISGLAATPIASATAYSLAGVDDGIDLKSMDPIIARVNAERTAGGQQALKVYKGLAGSPIDSKLRADQREAMAGNAGYVPDGHGMDPHIFIGDKLMNGKSTASVLAHELGHAKGRMIGGARGQGIMRYLSTLLTPMAAGSMGFGKGDGKDFGKTELTALGVGGAATGGVLAEEARASLNARALLKTIGKSPKGLRRAFLSYVLAPVVGGAAAAGAGYGLGKLRNNSKHAGLLQQPPSPIQQADAKVLAATGKKPEPAQQSAQAAQPKQAGIKYTKQELEMLKALRDMARLKHLTQAHREGRLPAHMLDRIKTPDHERWWKQAAYSSQQGAQDQVAAGQARANAAAVGRDMYGMPLPKPQIAKTPTPTMAKKGQYSTPFDQWELHSRFRALLGLHALA